MQVGHAGKSTAHHTRHLVAGDDHVRVGQAIQDLAAVAKTGLEKMQAAVKKAMAT